MNSFIRKLARVWQIMFVFMASFSIGAGICAMVCGLENLRNQEVFIIIATVFAVTHIILTLVGWALLGEEGIDLFNKD